MAATGPANWSWSTLHSAGQWDTDLLDWVDDKQLWHPDTDSDTDSSDDDEPLVIESETFET